MGRNTHPNSCCNAKQSMLLCKRNYCSWYLVYIFWFPDDEAAFGPPHRKGEYTMSKIAVVAFAPSQSLFRRLLAVIDRVLMVNAQIAVRNGDVPHFGL